MMNVKENERILCRARRKLGDSSSFEDAIFHGWVDWMQVFSEMVEKYLIGKIAYGVVEYMDGTVEKVRFEDIQFAGAKGIIQKSYR